MPTKHNEGEGARGITACSACSRLSKRVLPCVKEERQVPLFCPRDRDMCRRLRSAKQEIVYPPLSMHSLSASGPKKKTVAAKQWRESRPLSQPGVAAFVSLSVTLGITLGPSSPSRADLGTPYIYLASPTAYRCVRCMI